MLDLLIATLEMMGLTFVIGFFVAFIIKMIAFDTGHPHGR